MTFLHVAHVFHYLKLQNSLSDSVWVAANVKKAIAC
jgi:hypothetical protein